MYKEGIMGWLKHLDFILIDAGLLEISLVIAYWLRHGFGGVTDLYQNAMLVVFVLHICTVFFLSSYKGIIRRGYLVELKKVMIHCLSVTVGMIVWMFTVQEAEAYSRVFVFIMYPTSVIFLWIGRLIWKRVIRVRMRNRKEYRKLLLITTENNINETLNDLQQPFREYMISGAIIYDTDQYCGEKIRGVPIVADKQNMGKYIQSNVIDEVFLDIGNDNEQVKKLTEFFVSIGMTVHVNLMPCNYKMEERRVQSFGKCLVMTTSMKIATPWQIFVKRLMDVVGGIVGLVGCGIFILVFGPVIKKQSPGSILFSQNRVGRGGRIFRIYKIRTMYMDAEERKKELMDKNQMSGFMFKMEDDPRIIPIGHFLRKTSIDEFPQFWNVLKGDMSLVGTRPPTVDEYEQYELGHRKRLAIKPGITGMWQVSGRSSITDFEKIVALDATYIEHWSITLDIKILWKTVVQIFKGDGAM